MFAGGGFGVEVELGEFAGEERVAFGVEVGDVALGVLDLAGDAEELGGGAFAGDGGVDLAVVVEETLEGFGVAAGVGLVGAGHEEGEVLLLGVVAGEVRVDALGEVAEEGFEAGGWIELFSFVGCAEGFVVGLLGLAAGLFSAEASGVGVVEGDLALGDAGFELVELGVEDADLAEVAAFEGFELGAELGELGLALGEGGADEGELLALVEEGGGVRGWLEDDLGGHTDSRGGSLQFSRAEVGISRRERGCVR